MLCEKCKTREAKILVSENINGVRSDHYYCLECAQNLKFGGLVFEGDFPLSKLLSNLLAQTSGQKQDEETRRIVCPTCGTSYEEFVDNSRFGCKDCYEVFDLLIGDTVKKLQGNEAHKGKKPKYRTRDISEEVEGELTGSFDKKASDSEKFEEIVHLKRLLEEAVSKEEYEEAATLRDRIRSLEQTGGDRNE